MSFHSLTLQQFNLWFRNLNEREKADLRRRSLRQDSFKKNRMQLSHKESCKDWTCTMCRCENTAVYWKNIPFSDSSTPLSQLISKCRCCGSKPGTTRLDHEVLSKKNIILNQRIASEWNDLIQDIEQNPNDNQCDGPNSHIIDSCPMIQKLFLMMKYYHIHIGKTVVNIKNAEEYRMDSMSDLVEDLSDISLTKLVDIFEHVTTVHCEPQMFEYFIENIGSCDEGPDCHILQRHRARNRVGARKLSTVQDDEKVDGVEKHTLSFFDKWHSFLFHHKFEDNDLLLKLKAIEMDFSPQNIEREFSGKYVDYGFGLWIDYTTYSPSFESMKQEITGNAICAITSDQWQHTLDSAMTHFQSRKIQTDKRYTAKRVDEKYGVMNIGQKIGIEHLVSILLYCNYTDLQSRFSETFRGIQHDDTDEVIAERHCRNFYWFGRCVPFIFDFIWDILQ